jgi:GNAT superfamily N-acetyltransferase
MGPYIEQLYGPWDDEVQWGFFDKWFHPENVRVITVDGEDVGVLGLEDRDDEVYVTRIEVHPDRQNRGVGAAVMRVVLQQAKEEGKAVSLHVFEINPARGFYQSLGFVDFDQHEGRTLMKATPE